jgi:hypothetical protein
VSDAPAVPPRRLAVPFTPAGVAAFAGRGAGRVLAWQLAAALLAAWVVQDAWRATWEAALDKAAAAVPPAAGRLAAGRLTWSGTAPAILHEGPFLHVLVVPDGLLGRGRGADVQLTLVSNRVVFQSLLGFTALPYPPGLEIPLDRVTTPGTWAAWRGPVRRTLAAGTFAGLLAAWGLLAAAYAAPLRLWVWAQGRTATAGGCWRMAGAALVPGALLMLGAIALYARGVIRLEGLLLAQPLHLLPGWALLLLAPRHLPRPAPAATAAANPFAAAEGAPPAAAGENPFRGPPA